MNLAVGVWLLARVQAAIVEPADCAIRQGSPAVARLFAGLRRPKHAILDAYRYVEAGHKTGTVVIVP